MLERTGVDLQAFTIDKGARQDTGREKAKPSRERHLRSCLQREQVIEMQDMMVFILSNQSIIATECPAGSWPDHKNTMQLRTLRRSLVHAEGHTCT